MSDRTEVPLAGTHEAPPESAQPVPSPRLSGWDGDAWDLPAAFNAFGAPAGGTR